MVFKTMSSAWFYGIVLNLIYGFQYQLIQNTNNRDYFSTWFSIVDVVFQNQGLN